MNPNPNRATSEEQHRANPDIYNYTPDDSLLVQFSGSRLREITSQIGEELEPSIWLGEVRYIAHQCVSTTICGIGATFDSANTTLTIDGMETEIRTNRIFGLCRDGANPSAGTMVYPFNTADHTFHGQANFNIWNPSTKRENQNSLRWTDKETVNTSHYNFYPMTKLFKGGAVAYFTIIAYKELPDNFASLAAYSTWWDNANNRWSGTPEEYDAVKETYPNVYEIQMKFKCGAAQGQSRQVECMLFYPQNMKCTGQNLSMWDGSSFTTQYNNLTMSAGVIPQGARVINYFATPYIFRGVRTTVIAQTSEFNNNHPFGSSWFFLGGFEGFHRWVTIDCGTWKIQTCFCTYDISKLIDLATGLGFAATNATASIAQNGNIDTNENIWTPTYDDNGNIDGNTNDEEEKTEYTTAGENGEGIQPNFNPYGGDDDDEEYPDADPSEDQQTDEIFLPTATLSSYGVFNRSYVMNKMQVKNLSTYLWNSDASTFNTILADLALVGDNRMNSIINLIMFPFELPHQDDMHTVRIGRHNCQNVIGHYLDDTNLVFDLGECYLYAKYQNFLDYEPYTQSWLYVPFCGMFKIPSQQFMNKYIHVKLAVDLLTGAGQAIIYAGGIPIIYKNCRIGMQIPVTGADSGYTIRNYIQGSMNILGGEGQMMRGNIMAGETSVISGLVNILSAQNAPIESVGANSPQCGLLMPNKSYFIVERPKPLIKNVPDYGALIGYACYKSDLIGNFTGFSKFANVKLDISTANDFEKSEIIRLLEQGVYL